MLDKSDTAIPFCNIFNRGPSKPRIIGRDAPAPNADADTPSSPDKVSPREPRVLSRNSSPANTFAGVKICEFSSLPNGSAVTTTEGNVFLFSCAFTEKALLISAQAMACANSFNWTCMISPLADQRCAI